MTEPLNEAISVTIMGKLTGKLNMHHCENSLMNKEVRLSALTQIFIFAQLLIFNLNHHFIIIYKNFQVNEISIQSLNNTYIGV